MFDVVSVGEVVIDFSMCGKGAMGNPAYEMNPGGAPANVLVANTALGGKTAFIGMVGDDLFGNFLIKSLAKYNIDNSGMKKTNEASTLITFVSLDETGDRTFNFVKGSGTDFLLKPEDVDLSIIDQAKIVHTPVGIGRRYPGSETLYYVLDYAKKNGKIISCDPNYRPGIWETEELTREAFIKTLRYSDLVKVSEEEMSIITGVDQDDYETGAKMIFDAGKKAVFVTLGAKGAYFITKDESGFVEGFPVDAVDTTGCGDAFMGTIHYYYTHESGLTMREIVRRANATGALCATKAGAFDAMPTKEELYRFLGL